MPPLNLPEPPRDARPVRRRGGRSLQSLTLQLETITPILGGGPVARQLDELDVIRVPTLRGHLRFWWRTLHGYPHADKGDGGREALARAERELWGGMGSGEAEPRRSLIELRVTDIRRDSMKKDPSSIDQGAPEAYALWPARGTKSEPPAPRWKPGLRFTLELLAPEGEPMAQAEQSLRAWLLFGGYGSRVRRGCGSVTLATPKERERWLPASAARSELRRLFGSLPLFEPERAGPPLDMPLLRGAYLSRRGSSHMKATNAWEEALGWLRDFRQESPRPSAPSAPGQHARNPGEGNRAGRSNWPEADKIRHHSGQYPQEHAPREEHVGGPAWPRAGFGLPIIFHFQRKDRRGNDYRPAEPQGFELLWKEGGQLRDRLASPLIVKALPLADGRFEPIALWLERGYPQQGQVVLTQKGTEVPGTRTPFDTLRAGKDLPLFQPLRQAPSLREAFLSWLEATGRAKEA